MHPADFLLIDIGNTTTKLRLATCERLLGTTRRLPTTDLAGETGNATLKRALGRWRYRRAVLSSVVPRAGQAVTAALPEALTIHVETNSGIDLRGYPGRKTLGADRVANMAGALALHGPGPLIVVDFGTAATFNALDADGKFLGGVIAPGLRVVADGLTARTALLPPVRLTGTRPRALGRNTQEALRAGALIGFRGMVREIVAELQAELGGAARVVATGGDARLLSTHGLAMFDVLDPELTLQGLRIIAARQ